MTKIYSRDRKRIRDWYKQWFTITEIQKKFKKKYIELNDISKIAKTYNRLEWVKEWDKTYLKCNTCKNLKPYTYEYYQTTNKSSEKKCRVCRNLVRRNKRRLDSNLWRKNIRNINDTRRWWRNKIIRIVDINYYWSSYYKPKYITAEKDINYFRWLNKKICIE